MPRPVDDADDELEDDFDAQEDEADEIGEVDEGDEGEDQVDADHEEDDSSGADERQAGQADQVGRQSRGSTRVAKLAQERDAERRRADEAERRAQEAEQRANQRARTEAEQAEAARLEQMMPDERNDYLRRRDKAEQDARFAQLEFRTQDSADRTAFEGLCARNPTAAKLATQVEEQLAASRRAGMNYPRETILKFVIGERALKSAPKAKARQERRADDQRQQQRGRPGAARSDINAGSNRRGSEQEARRKRLEDVII